MVRILWFLGAALLVGAIAVVVVILHFNKYKESPASSASQPVNFIIPKGASFKTVSLRLFQKEVITNLPYFDILARLEKKKGRLKAGEYALNKNMTPIKVLDILTEGRSIQIALTIPEGFNLREIADRVEKRGLGKSGIFWGLAHSRELLDSYGIAAGSFEGYLFPDTYFFTRGVKESAILAKMADNFVKKVKREDILNKAEKIGFTLHKLLTLASLIEKETGLASEKNLVSGVFHNRLRKGMLLQCDPTVIYAMEEFDGNIRKKDLKLDSPYNTYVYKGLPPGPIANPGLESVLAALEPAENNYLYFVAKKEGGHYFSKSLREHNRAVTKHQLGR